MGTNGATDVAVAKLGTDGATVTMLEEVTKRIGRLPIGRLRSGTTKTTRREAAQKTVGMTILRPSGTAGGGLGKMEFGKRFGITMMPRLQAPTWRLLGLRGKGSAKTTIQQRLQAPTWRRLLITIMTMQRRCGQPKLVGKLQNKMRVVAKYGSYQTATTGTLRQSQLTTSPRLSRHQRSQ